MAFDHANPWARLAIKNRLQELNPQTVAPELRQRLASILSQEALEVVAPR